MRINKTDKIILFVVGLCLIAILFGVLIDFNFQTLDASRNYLYFIEGDGDLWGYADYYSTLGSSCIEFVGTDQNSVQTSTYVLCGDYRITQL